MSIYQFRNKSGTQFEKIKKELQRLFDEYDLEITAESNQKIVNYLDITWNLKDCNFRPYHKPDDQHPFPLTHPHPPNIIKHMPASKVIRLSNLSSTEILFKQSTILCEDNLRESGYNKKLHINPRTLTIKNMVIIREKSYGLTHRSAKMF